MSQSRRSFLKRSAASSVLALSWPSFASVVRAMPVVDTPQALRMPLAINGACTFSMGNAAIWPDGPTERILCNGAPVAMIECEKGQSLTVPVTNRTSSPISIHWHGMDVPADMDGHPKDVFSSGTDKVYSFPILNRAGLYFFHSHSHMATAREVYAGMAGALIVRDEEERALSLPSGEFELPLLVQDVRVTSSNQTPYSPSMNDTMNGWMGNKVLVNATANAIHRVKKATYRLRLVNGSNARFYDLAFSNGHSFTIIGTDGGLLEEPVMVSKVRFAPGERLDLLVDFSAFKTDEAIRLVSTPFTAPVEMMSPTYPLGIALDILTFVVDELQGPVFKPPIKLCSYPELPTLNGLPTRIFSLSMARGMGMGMRPQINGLSYSMDRVDFAVPPGKNEIIEFRNTETAMFHPMHMHGRQFRVLSRSGGSLLPTDQGFKDTILVGPSETVRVLVQHSTYEGMFLLHCHNLEHEDDGMMQNYLITSVSGVDTTPPCTVGFYPSPASTTTTVSCSEDGLHDLTMYDVQGRVVMEVSNIENGTILNVQGLASGTYHVVCAGVNTMLCVQH